MNDKKDNLESYGFEREREYIRLLRGEGDGIEFTKKVREDVERRLKALTK